VAKFNYVLAYDPATTSPTAMQLHVFITKHRDIESWYYPFAGTYILKSDRALVELINEFVTFFGTSPFLLSWVPHTYLSGSLPPQVWNWVNNQDNTLLPKS
jgi:hypothetical protein